MYCTLVIWRVSVHNLLYKNPSMSQPDAEIDFPMKRMYSNCRGEKNNKKTSGVTHTLHQ